MEKTQAVGKLKKAGYQVQFDSSIVSILLPPKANINQEIKKLRAFLQEIGYDASFGIKQVRDTSHEETADKENSNKEKDNQGNMSELEIGRQFSLADFGLS